MSAFGEYIKNLAFKSDPTADADSIVGNDSENSSKSILFKLSQFFRTDKTYDPKDTVLYADKLLIKDTEDNNAVKEITAGQLGFIRTAGYSTITAPGGHELVPVKDTEDSDTYKEVSLNTIAEFLDIHRAVLETAGDTPEVLIGFTLPVSGAVRIEGGITVYSAGNGSGCYKITVLAGVSGILWELVTPEYLDPALYTLDVSCQVAAGILYVIVTGVYTTDIKWAGRFSGIEVA